MARRLPYRAAKVETVEMLRVTQIEVNGSPVLKLEGKLGGPWVDELQHCWDASAAGTHHNAIVVDLRGVSYVDHRGRNLLLRMEREGACLVECSDFIRQLLQAKDAGQKTAQSITHKTTNRTTKRTKKENHHASTLRA